MKFFLSFIAVCALLCTFAGCQNNKTDGDKASPGAMKDCPNCASGKCDCMCCKEGGKKMDTASGCCCAAGSTCCKAKANMGAVGDNKSDGCCASEKSDASMGAVGEKKDGGCCSGAKGDASLGAVGEKKSCTGVCPVTGKPLN